MILIKAYLSFNLGASRTWKGISTRGYFDNYKAFTSWYKISFEAHSADLYSVWWLGYHRKTLTHNILVFYQCFLGIIFEVENVISHSCIHIWIFDKSFECWILFIIISSWCKTWILLQSWLEYLPNELVMGIRACSILKSCLSRTIVVYIKWRVTNKCLFIDVYIC